ncbi:MAG TPA: hypothetical protein PK939_08000, partial [Bacteroidales bacterium]|nr:hypothetical protein [Bacteroidales bacterium]
MEENSIKKEYRQNLILGLESLSVFLISFYLLYIVSGLSVLYISWDFDTFNHNSMNQNALCIFSRSTRMNNLFPREFLSAFQAPGVIFRSLIRPILKEPPDHSPIHYSF